MAEFFLQNRWADYLLTAVAGLIFGYLLCLIVFFIMKPVRKEKNGKFLLLNLGFIFLFSLLLPHLPKMIFYPNYILVILEGIIFAALLFFVMYLIVRNDTHNRKKLLIELSLQSVLTCIGYYLSRIVLSLVIAQIMAK